MINRIKQMNIRKIKRVFSIIAEYLIENSHAAILYVIIVAVMMYLTWQHLFSEPVDNIANHHGILLNVLTALILFLIVELNFIKNKFTKHCRLYAGVFFDDVKKVLKLKNENKCIELSNLEFNYLAPVAQENSVSSINVLPLTRLTFDYYLLKNNNTGKKEWFVNNPKLPFQRVVIIETILLTNLFTPDNQDIIDFLVSKRNYPWKVTTQKQLEHHDSMRLFRNFSVLTMKDDAKWPKKLSYFTYLDSKHETIFTKSSWAQYETQDLEYIGYLEKDFNELWENKKLCLDINDWLTHRGK